MRVRLRVQPDRGRREMGVIAQEDEVDEVFGGEEGQQLGVEYDNADDDQAECTTDEKVIERRVDEGSADE